MIFTWKIRGAMLYLALLMPLMIIFRAVTVLKINKYYKSILIFLTLAAAFKFQIVYFFGGPMFFAPDLPPAILVAASWVYAVAVSFFVLLAAAEIILLIYRVLIKIQRKKLPENFRHHNNTGNLVLLCLSAMLAAWVIFSGMRQPAIKNLVINDEDLPQQAENMRIVLLADLHIDRINSGSKIEQIVAKTNALKPDLIIIAGDIVDGTLSQRKNDVQILQKLSAKYGVFGVPGNHEYFSGYADWMKFFKQINLQMLENTHVKLPNNIYLAGITDLAAKRRNLPVPDVEKAVQGIDKKEFVLLMSHRPSEAVKAAELGVDLTLSGHTHGGMIRGFDLIVARFNDNFVAGLYQINDLKLYVSNGTMIWNGFPFRLGRSSEITLITLKNGKKQALFPHQPLSFEKI